MHYQRVLAAITVGILVAAFVARADDKKTEYNYVGTKFCAACHKAGKGGTAYAVWEKSAHAKAYKTLEGDEAKKIAKAKGLKTAPAESPECLKCHVPGGGSAKNVEKTFDMKEGVTCEVCHGAASGYKILHSKGDLAKSKAAGLMIAEKTGKMCETCHNAESPTHKEFKFAEMWKKIEHGLPPKK